METIGRYQLQEKIGRGSMATVYRALDSSNNREVAVKVMSSGFSYRAEIVQQLQHQAMLLSGYPHIAPVYEVGAEKGITYLAMQLLLGGNLRDRFKQGLLNQEQLWQVMAQLAQALDAAHAQGIVHRDIKPANILFDEQGKAYLVDFGLAIMTDATMHAAGLPGTLAYMSPEQFVGGQITGRTDQYSLAVIIFELLAGYPPFQGNTTQVMFKHVHEPPPVAKVGDARIATALLRALAKQPEDRYETVSTFIADLVPPTTKATTLMDADMTFVLNPIRPPTMMERPSGQYPIPSWETAETPPPTENKPVSFPPISSSPDETISHPLPVTMTPQHIETPPIAEPPEEEVVAPRDVSFDATYVLTDMPPVQPTPTGTPRPLTTAERDFSQVPRRKIVAGAGGPTTPVSRFPLTGAQIAGGGIVLVLVVVALALWQSSIFSGGGEETAESTTPTTETSADTTGNVVTILQSAPDAQFWIGNGEKFPLPDETLDWIGDEPLHIITGAKGVAFRLPGRTRFYLDAGTEVEIEHSADRVTLGLQQGRVVVETADTPVTIETPPGTTAQVATSGLMGVGYDESPFLLDVDCFTGSCEVKDLDISQILSQGQRTYLEGGTPVESQPARYELYAFAPVIATPTATPIPPTPTHTPLPTITPTVLPTDTPAPTETPTPSPTPTSTPGQSICFTFIITSQPSEIRLNWPGEVPYNIDYFFLTVSRQGGQPVVSRQKVEFEDPSRFFGIAWDKFTAGTYSYSVEGFNTNNRLICTARGTFKYPP